MNRNYLLYLNKILLSDKSLEFLIFEVQENINKTKKNNKILFKYNK